MDLGRRPVAIRRFERLLPRRSRPGRGIDVKRVARVASIASLVLAGVTAAATAVIGLGLWSLTTDLNEGNKIPLSMVIAVTAVPLLITIALLGLGLVLDRAARGPDSRCSSAPTTGDRCDDALNGS